MADNLLGDITGTSSNSGSGMFDENNDLSSLFNSVVSSLDNINDSLNDSLKVVKEINKNLNILPNFYNKLDNIIDYIKLKNILEESLNINNENKNQENYSAIESNIQNKDSIEQKDYSQYFENLISAIEQKDYSHNFENLTSSIEEKDYSHNFENLASLLENINEPNTNFVDRDYSQYFENIISLIEKINLQNPVNNVNYSQYFDTIITDINSLITSIDNIDIDIDYQKIEDIISNNKPIDTEDKSVSLFDKFNKKENIKDNKDIKDSEEDKSVSLFDRFFKKENSKDTKNTKESKNKNQKIQAKLNPKPNDLLTAKDINSLVASGLLMIHNDLNQKQATGKNSSGKTASLASGVGGFAGAALAGAVGGLFAGLSPVSAVKLRKIVEQLNDDITYEDIKDDSQIKQAQIEGLATYVKTYFISQASSSLIKEVSTAVGGSAVNATKGLVTSLINLIPGNKKQETKVQSILNDLLDDMDSSDYIDDSEIIQEEKNGVKAYLASYFVAQTSQLLLDTTAETVGAGAANVITGFLNSFITGIGGEELHQESKIKLILNDILDSMDSSDYIEDEDVKKELKTGIKAYIATYFIAQTSQLALTTTAETAGGMVGNVIAGALSPLIDLISGDKQKSKLEEVTEAIIDSYSSDDALQSEEIKDALNKGMASYIKMYFISQSTELAADSVKNTVSSTVNGLVTGVISGIASLFTGKKEEDPTQQKLQEVLKIAIDNIDPEVASTSDEVKDAINEGMASYIITYFKAQATASVAGDTVSSLAESAGKSVKKFFTALFGKDDEEDTSQSLVQEKLSQSLTNAISTINPESFKNADYTESIKNSMGEVISSVLEKLGESLTSNTNVNFNNKIVVNGKQVSMVDYATEGLGLKFTNSLRDIFQNIDFSLSENDSRNTTKSSIKNVVSNTFSILEDKFIKDAQSKLSLNTNDYNSIKDAFVRSVTGSITTIKTEPVKMDNEINKGVDNNSELIETANNISSKMDTILNDLVILVAKTNDTYQILTSPMEKINTNF